MLNRVFKLLSTWQLFHLECTPASHGDYLATDFMYPRSLIFATNNQRFCFCKISEGPRPKQTFDDEPRSVRTQLEELQAPRFEQIIRPVNVNRKVLHP